MMKEWFRARNSWGAAIRTLTDEEAGRLMKALWEYTMTGNQVELQGIEKGIFALILFNLEQDEQRDEELAKKRAANGAAGGKQKAANLAKAKQGQEERKRAADEGAADGKTNAEFATGDIANEANARFATDGVANVANANNKKQKQIQKQNKNQSQKTDLLFARFWDAYPKHVKKEEAKTAFEQIHPDLELLERMIATIEKWQKTRQWNEDGDRYIPNPDTWLTGKRWEDELPKAGTAKGSVIAQQYEQRDYSGVQAELMAEQDREMSEYLGGFPTQGCRPFSAENEHTGSFSGRGEPPRAPFGE